MKNQKGFTLFEALVITIVISIIATFATPLIQDHFIRIHRADAKAALLHAGAKLEHYYLESHTYEKASLSKLRLKQTTDGDYYLLSLSNLSDTTYTIHASPNLQKQNDPICGTLTLTQAGIRSASGSTSHPLEDCWQK